MLLGDHIYLHVLPTSHTHPHPTSYTFHNMIISLCEYSVYVADISGLVSSRMISIPIPNDIKITLKYSGLKTKYLLGIQLVNGDTYVILVIGIKGNMKSVCINVNNQYHVDVFILIGCAIGEKILGTSHDSLLPMKYLDIMILVVWVVNDYKCRRLDDFDIIIGTSPEIFGKLFFV